MADDNKSPILNNPYEEPRFYYDTDTSGNLDYNRTITGRRPFMTSIDIVPKQKTQPELFSGSDIGYGEEDPNAPFINSIRAEVKKWRENKV